MPVVFYDKITINIDTRRTSRDPLPKELEALKNAPPKRLLVQARANMQGQTIIKKQISRGRNK